VDGALLISALVIERDGSIAGFQDKVQLDPSEEDTYAAGAGRHVFKVGPLTFGVAICHEGFRYPETVRWPVRHGAQLVFHPHFDVAGPGRFRPSAFADPANSFHEKAALCRAAENTCFFATVNCAARIADDVGRRAAGRTVVLPTYGKAGRSSRTSISLMTDCSRRD
jgi:predicted amidohydrolase